MCLNAQTDCFSGIPRPPTRRDPLHQIESCRRRGVEAYAYLRDALTRLPQLTNWQIKDITPKAWAKSRTAARPKAARRSPSAPCGWWAHLRCGCVATFGSKKKFHCRGTKSVRPIGMKPDTGDEAIGRGSRLTSRGDRGQRAGTDQPRNLGDPALGQSADEATANGNT